MGPGGPLRHRVGAPVVDGADDHASRARPGGPCPRRGSSSRLRWFFGPNGGLASTGVEFLPRLGRRPPCGFSSRPRRHQEPLESAPPAANPATSTLPRCSRASMVIMHVRAMIPKAVTIRSLHQTDAPRLRSDAGAARPVRPSIVAAGMMGEWSVRSPSSWSPVARIGPFSLILMNARRLWPPRASGISRFCSMGPAVGAARTSHPEAVGLPYRRGGTRRVAA